MGSSAAQPEAPNEALIVSRVPSEYVPRQRPALLELDMDDGVILYDDASSLVHHLSPSASVLWQLCRGEATVGELSADIAHVYGLEGSGVEAQLTAAVAEFDALGLVEDLRGTFPEQAAAPRRTAR